MGSVQEQMGTSMVQEDFELICFDSVSEPSTPNAFVYPKDYKANPIRMREHKENKIDNLFDKILRD